MTKSELIEKMAKDVDISKAVAGRALDSFIDGIVAISNPFHGSCPEQRTSMSLP